MHLPLDSAYKGSFGSHAIHNRCILMLALHFFYFLTRCLGKKSHHLRLSRCDTLTKWFRSHNLLNSWLHAPPMLVCPSYFHLVSNGTRVRTNVFCSCYPFARGCMGSVFRGRRTTPATMNVAINHNMSVRIQSATIAPIPDGSHVSHVDPCFSPDQAI